MNRQQHQRNGSYPVSPSQYDDSPTFLYSAGRPPTNYSHHSWTPPSAADPPGRHARRSSLPPPLPVIPVTKAGGPSRVPDGKVSPESDYSPPARGRQAPANAPYLRASPVSSASNPSPMYGQGAVPAVTPLYARASWDDPYNASNSDSDDIKSPPKPWIRQQGEPGRRMTASSRGRSAYVADPNRPDSWADEPTAWSKSSYNPNIDSTAQPRTRGGTGTGTKSALGTVFEEQDYEEKGYYDDISIAPRTAPQTAPSLYTPQSHSQAMQGGRPDNRVPPVPPIDEWYMPKSTHQSLSRHSRRSSAPMRPTLYDSPSAYTARHSISGPGTGRDRDTVGSVFDMNALSAQPYLPDFTPGGTKANRGAGAGIPLVPPLPSAVLPPMLSPSKQHQLGRMSVAPARYTLPSSARGLDSAPNRTPHTGMQMNGFPPHTAVQPPLHLQPLPQAQQHNPFVADPFADPPHDPAFDIDEKVAARFHQQQQQARGPDDGVNPYRDPALGWEPAQTLDELNAEQERKGAFGDTLDKVRNSTFGVYYRTYRLFARPLLTVCAAMCLSLTIQGPSGGTEWGTIVKLAKGGMGVMPPETDGKEVGLGLLGWCVLDTEDPVCLPYRNGDFISTSKKYHIPAEGSSLLFIFANLVTALMTLLYLLAAFHLVTAFLHFFLFFGISVPFDHLYTTDPLPPLTGFTAASRPIVRRGGVTSRQILQKEVDMRVRCEKDPYEAYYWVWWAWWAHRRSGLGDLFAMVVGLMGVGTLIMATQFYSQVGDAANPGSISIGAGTFVALLAFFLTLDPFICAIRYLCRAQSSFLTFLHPPEPSVGTIVLPPRSERMRHRKKPSGTAFRLGNGNAAAQPGLGGFGEQGNQLRQLDQPDPHFDTYTRPGTVNFPLPPPSRASRAASQFHRNTLRHDRGQSTFYDPHAPPMPGQPGAPSMPQTGMADLAELDEETVRWLAAYPSDPDLVPLIERVKDTQRRQASGEQVEEDEFILSDVGLLYLRPDVTGDGAEQDALLVPPRGAIRKEILSDTHFAIIDEEDETAAHWEAEEMVRQMGETFWWPSMGSDAHAFVANCDGCGGGESAKGYK